MSWEPISKSLGTVLDERLSSPLISTFTISWSIINYKFFVILFSKESVAATFELLDDTYWNKTCKLWPEWAACTPMLQFLILPAIATAIYLFILPSPARWIFLHWRKNQQRISEIRDLYDGQQKISVEESRAYRQRNRELEQQLEEASREADRLKDDLRKAETDLNTRLEEARATAAEQLRQNSEVQFNDLLEVSRERDALRHSLDAVRRKQPQLFASEEEEEEEDDEPFSVSRMLDVLRAEGVFNTKISTDMAMVLAALGRFQTATAEQLAQRTSGLTLSQLRVLLIELTHKQFVSRHKPDAGGAHDEFSLTQEGQLLVNAMDAYRAKFPGEEMPRWMWDDPRAS